VTCQWRRDNQIARSRPSCSGWLAKGGEAAIRRARPAERSTPRSCNIADARRTVRSGWRPFAGVDGESVFDFGARGDRRP
jgi:hypothetical protein